MNHRETILLIVVALYSSIALADDFKTIDGREYKNVMVTRVDPDGINVKNTKAGVIAKLYFTELPKEIQQRFNYDSEKAVEYSEEQKAALEQAQKQRDDWMKQKAGDNERLTKDIDGIQSTGEQQKRIQALRARYDELEKEERDLVRRIQEAEQLPRYLTGQSGKKHYSYLNPAWKYVPDWEERLRDVRYEKDQVRQQLEQAQH